MKKLLIFPLVISSTLMLVSCSGKEDSEKLEDQKSTVETTDDIAVEANDMKARESVGPIDFRKLKELLPEEIAGFKRTEASGEKSGAMGFTISTAESKYKGDGNSSVKVEIFDTGGVAGVATMSLAAWTMADIDKETETGYEKTTKLEGHKAFEKYDAVNKSGELNVLVADRYVVNVNGNNVTVDKLKSILGDMDLEKLADLK
ncbi:hypothetical protein [Dyadobacter sp. NIV53]|uniref:hypothetical protein n=1 Tax=Dyadobacter sp. NIV53 TaxID=2861765 RepID=UPI001C877D84|nr:hypothetical protein [Dyadobacter sp. NIV53]